MQYLGVYAIYKWPTYLGEPKTEAYNFYALYVSVCIKRKGNFAWYIFK